MDAAQDVFIQLLRKKEQIVVRGPSSLLYTIATNVCLNRLRSHMRRGGEHAEIYEETVAANENTEEAVLTKHFLDTLFATEDAATQLTAVLHYADGFTLQETAAVVGMSVSGIRKRLRKLRRKGLALREA